MGGACGAGGAGAASGGGLSEDGTRFGVSGGGVGSVGVDGGGDKFIVGGGRRDPDGLVKDGGGGDPDELVKDGGGGVFIKDGEGVGMDGFTIAGVGFDKIRDVPAGLA